VYSESLGEVVVAIDCSGSVYGPAEQAGFAGHVSTILSEAKPAKVHVLYFDSQIQRHEELDPGLMDFSTHPKGGGGTAFEPIWGWCEDEGVVPAVCIVLTDTYGSFGQEPEYPVIWASIAENVTVPFGELIYVQ
jgi:predicted metal-dependent peptidase